MVNHDHEANHHLGERPSLISSKAKQFVPSGSKISWFRGFSTGFYPNLSHEKKNGPYFPFYWLFNRDPYHGFKSPHNWVVQSPLYLGKPGFFRCSICPERE